MSVPFDDEGGFTDSISEAPVDISTENYEIPSPQGSPNPGMLSGTDVTSIQPFRNAMIAAACSIYDVPPMLMSSPLINSKSFKERRKSVRFTEIVVEHIIETLVTPTSSSGSPKKEIEISLPAVDDAHVAAEPLVVEDPNKPVTTSYDPVVLSPHRRLHSHPVIMAAALHEPRIEHEDIVPISELLLSTTSEDTYSTHSSASPVLSPTNFNFPLAEHATSSIEPAEDSSGMQKSKTERKFMITVDKVKENNDKITALFEENNAAIKQAIRYSRVMLGNILDDTYPTTAAVGGLDDNVDNAEELLETKYFLAREALHQKKRTDISNQTVMDILRNHSELSPYLQHCCSDDLSALVEDATLVDFCHGETVMQLKEYMNCIYVVLQGSITVYKYDYEINDQTGEIVWDPHRSSASVNHPGSLLGKCALEGLTLWDCTGVNTSTESLSLSLIKDGPHHTGTNSDSRNAVSTSVGKDYTLSLCVIPLQTVLRYIGLHTLAAKDHALYFWKYTRLYNEITRFNRDYVISSMALTYGKKRRSIVTDYRQMDVMGTAKIRKFPANVNIFQQGQSRHYLYYLTKGSAKYVRQFPDWINNNNSHNGSGNIAASSSSSSGGQRHDKIPLPSEIELELILSRGDYSFMDGENIEWVKHMAKVDETILRSKTENPLLYEHKKRKYSRFEFHKNTLVTLTACELISIPIAEMVKSMSLFNNLLVLTNKKYSVLNISNEDLVRRYYQQQEWLREKAALVREIMTQKQANKVADYFHCPVSSNLNLDYVRRHTPGSVVRPLTASIESQETAKFKTRDESVPNTGRSSGSGGDSSVNAVLRAKTALSTPAFAGTNTSLTSTTVATGGVVAVPEYSSNTIYLAQTTGAVAPFKLDTPRPPSAATSGASSRRSATNSTTAAFADASSNNAADAKPKVVFGYGIYTRYMNDVSAEAADVSNTFFVTSEGGGGSGSPRRPQSARSSSGGKSSRPVSARSTGRPLSARSMGGKSGTAAVSSTTNGKRPGSATTFGRSLRFGATDNSNNSSNNTPVAAAATALGETKPQRPSSAPPSSSAIQSQNRRFSRPVVAKLNLAALNKTSILEFPVETKINASDKANERPAQTQGDEDDIQLPNYERRRRKGGNIEISNLLDLVYQANELKKRLEVEQRDNGDGDGYIYRYKSDYEPDDNNSSSSSGSSNHDGSECEDDDRSLYRGRLVGVEVHNTSREALHEVRVSRDENENKIEEPATEVTNFAANPTVQQVARRPTSSGYGQAPSNAVKKSPDFYAQIYKKRLISNSPKKRFIDEFILKHKIDE